MNDIPHEAFESFIKQKPEPEWVRKKRRQAFLRLPRALLPSFRYGLQIMVAPEQFDFSGVLPKIKTTANRIKINCPKENGLFFYNGAQFYDDPRFVSFFNEEWSTEKTSRTQCFHDAFCNDVVCLAIPPGYKQLDPIEIVYDVQEGPLLSTFLMVIGPHAHVKIFLTKEGAYAPEHTYVSEQMRILVLEGAHLELFTLQNLPRAVVNVQQRIALQKRDSSVTWTELSLGSSYTKAETTSILDEQGASTTMLALFAGTGKQRYDIATFAAHQAQYTSSDIATKGVLNGYAKGLSRGLITIGKHAAHAVGYEKQDVLLLTDNAEGDAIPNLEIHNNEVKCSHGSTIGQIDPEKLFYLQSRGLDEETAKQKIVEGYFMPVLQKIKEQHMQQRITQLLLQALSQHPNSK
ncbi:Fe-S cluster assembly protein SufD [Candidatus Woesearchaeota archaeon]|nr:Fe-S cluster assembly protein SufD [Candidatus Woesearchaeota archaeon]